MNGGTCLVSPPTYIGTTGRWPGVLAPQGKFRLDGSETKDLGEPHHHGRPSGHDDEDCDEGNEEWRDSPEHDVNRLAGDRGRDVENAADRWGQQADHQVDD